jgi:hypothetical protein
MANNAGRQGGGNGQMNEHVEFTVKVSFLAVYWDQALEFLFSWVSTSRFVAPTPSFLKY